MMIILKIILLKFLKSLIHNNYNHKPKYCLNVYFQSNLSMKETYAYLWLAGKEYFPKNYKKRIKNG